MNIRTIFCSFILLLAAGCTVLDSHRQDTNKTGLDYNLPIAYVTLQLTLGDKGDLTVTSTSDLLPDLNQAYTIKYNASAFSNDNFCIARTKTGLLTAIQVRADDKTPEIVVAVAKTLKSIASLAFGVPVPPGSVGNLFFKSVTNATVPKTIKVSFVQNNPAQINAAFAFVKKWLSDAGVYGAAGNKESSFSSQDTKLLSALGLQKGANEQTSWNLDSLKRDDQSSKSDLSCPENKICYRNMVRIPVTITAGTLPISFAMDVIDMSQVRHLDVTRAFLVTKVTKITFDGGVPTEIWIHKQSEALALANLPLQVFDAILGVPADFVAKAFGSFKNQKQLIDELTALNMKDRPKIALDDPDTEPTSTIQCPGSPPDSGIKNTPNAKGSTPADTPPK